MYDHQLFMEGHRELIKLVQWISTPMFYTPACSGIDPTRVEQMAQGGIIIGDEPVGKGIESIHVLPKEDVSLILKTFCESHARIKHD